MADILGDTRTLLNIGDTSQDDILNIYMRRAVPLIQSYMNLRTTQITKTDLYGNTTTIDPIDVLLTYPDAVTEYIVESFRRRGNENMKQFSQGGRSGTYDNSLSDMVKALLPQPFIRTMSSNREGYYYGY